MRRNNKKALYEKIMRNVALEVKKALNESCHCNSTLSSSRQKINYYKGFKIETSLSTCDNCGDSSWGYWITNPQGDEIDNTFGYSSRDEALAAGKRSVEGFIEDGYGDDDEYDY